MAYFYFSQRYRKSYRGDSLDFSSLQTGFEIVRNTLTTFGQNGNEMLTYTAIRQKVSDLGNFQDQPITFTDADETDFVGIKDSFIGSLLEKLEELFPSDTINVLKSSEAIFFPKLYPDDPEAILAPPGWLSGERVGLMTWWL